LSLSKKERYIALAFQITSKELSPVDYSSALEKLLHTLNKNIFKSSTLQYKEAMKSGDDAAFQKYSEMVSLAKKHNIK